MGEVVTRDRLREIRERAKLHSKKVVFTNGCFDILHRGHIEYLRKARSLGDILVIGLNTDKSVRAIKGKGRPIVPEEDRAFLLCELRSVDYVCLFDEETPALLIDFLTPDVLVKGGDYAIDEVVGKDTVEASGGEVVIIPEVKGKSTSSIVDIISRRTCS
ncbi:MAG: D-glycero-beta-D-manno-heptose 1-phosphate adenylyltransferase [Candidatus Eisenbacteria bacterium]|nr:D-glycero-beta-D-manno-heptose 1-phosphate adenylyltransferase [Candidatus Eisenbacteria bacterium]